MILLYKIKLRFFSIYVSCKAFETDNNSLWKILDSPIALPVGTLLY